MYNIPICTYIQLWKSTGVCVCPQGEGKKGGGVHVHVKWVCIALQAVYSDVLSTLYLLTLPRI